MEPRQYTAADRQDVLDLQVHPFALDNELQRVFVIKDGDVRGAGVWYHRKARGETVLQYLAVNPPGNWTAFLKLCLACAYDARAAGSTSGRFRVIHPTLLARLQRQFRIEPVVDGVDADSGEAVSWTITVDVADIIEQLELVLG